MQETKEDFEEVVAKLKEFARLARNSSIRSIGDINLDELEETLLEASLTIECLSDLSINLIDDDGEVIFQIPDGQVREMMSSAVGKFIDDAINNFDDDDARKPSLIVPEQTMGEIVSNNAWGSIG